MTATATVDRGHPEALTAPLRRPRDADAFVAEAERITNEADWRALEGVYADDAVFERLIDSAHDVYRGPRAVIAAWRGYVLGMRARRMIVSKRTIMTSDDSILLEWHGTVGRGRPVAGLELWRFDGDGKVCEQRTLGSLAARPIGDVRTLLRAGSSYPWTGARVLFQLLRARALPNRHR